MKNSKYVVLKAIPLDPKGNNTIPVNTEISVTHDCIYMNGGLLPVEYQKDFAKLIEHESETGWKYLHPDNPIVGDSII